MKQNMNERKRFVLSYAFKVALAAKICILLVFLNLAQVFAVDGDNSLSLIASQQPGKTVTGTVTDETGSPIIGVSVVVKGTTIGTITDLSGNFSIAVPAGSDVLVFSFVGMQTQEIDVGTQTVLNITMLQDIIGLDEVVAIGYGFTRRKDLTSSVSTINPKDFNQGTFSSPLELLQGKVPGLNMTKDGNPYGSMAIILRGPSTLRGGAAEQPLFVVDGVVGVSLSSIPMDDIASIDVLRDASASAIYGSRAANGVIIITTKKGEAGVSRVSYNTYMGIERISRKIEMMTVPEYRAYLAQYGLSLDPVDDAGNDIDWQEEVTRTGISQQHNLSISGGNNTTTYIAGINYLKNAGIVKTTGLDRMTFRANVDQKALKDRLNVGVAVNATVTNSQHVPQELFDHMLTRLRTAKIYNDDGTYYENLTFGSRNPLGLIYQNHDDRKNKVFLGRIYGNLNLFDGFDLNVSGSYQNSTSERGYYNEINSVLAFGFDGYALRSSYESENKILEAYGTYNKDIGSHNFSIMGGYSWQEDVTGNGFQSTNRGFPSDVTTYYNLGLASPPSGYVPDYGTTSILTLRMISFYSRLNYNFANKYLLQATIRRDGSSAFGANNRWGTFPSVSAAWRLTEESFMDFLPMDLKVRASWGVSGNSLGFDPLISKVRYGSSGRFYYNGEYVTGIAPVANDNPNLKWESTTMLNVGVDWAALRGRLSGTVEYYDKLTDGLIWSYSVSTAKYLYGSLLANVGEVSNKGVEFTLNTVPVHTKDFYWNVSLNVSHNKNLITSLSDDEFSLERVDVGDVGGSGQSGNRQQVVEEGYPIGQFKMFKWAGLNASGISQFETPDGTIKLNPSQDEKHYFGDAQPKAFYGLTSNMTYRNLDLNLFFRGVTGNYILNATMAELNRVGQASHYHLPKYVLENDVPATDNQAHFVSDRYLEKGDYLRLDNITLGYSFKNLFDGALSRIRLYTTVHNAFVFTQFTGIDPEVNIGGIQPGLHVRSYYPKTRTFLFGINVDF